ncbi:MAG: bifunctional UDP-N-acetylglucosamine diphosphorylase/glucosamine-1-phosphate N-acetyltransferase GlmU [Anaerolineales bacterium]|nr:bifunctional UDP-N-acetylglucosamine diphosphorylase/glucosamine-1-phosphate N-acetyltransferase GlmU [Anaerolineales bacterium]
MLRHFMFDILSNMSIKTASVILAAGKGARMRSNIPKVLHTLGGRPLMEYALDLGFDICNKPPIVVVGFESEKVQECIGNRAKIVLQEPQLGTGHALHQTAGVLRGQADMIVVWAADMPLLSKETLQSVVNCQIENEGPISIVTAISNNDRGFGKVIRSELGEVQAIVEKSDATAEQLSINELNVGVYCFRSLWLWDELSALKPSANGEYYLTDLIKSASSQDEKIGVVTTNAVDEIIGINTRVHLAEAETALRTRINNRWMERGVTLIDPANTYIDSNVEIGLDTIVLPNTHLQGNTVVGSECTIGPNSTIRHSVINDRCKIESSVVEHATLGNDVDVGPFGHLRAGAHLDNGVHVGNFGEVKNSYLGPDVKMGHFSYVGDATIGARTNIGAGAITCNYGMDKNKHRTEIGEDVFIGSDTMLVAPLHIGSRVRTGAGSVVTKDLPDDSLAVGVPARIISRAVDDDIQLKDE